MNVYFFAAIFIAAIVIIAWTTGYGNDAVSVVASATGMAIEHDKLGWMDDEPLTAADTARIAQISGQGYGDNLSVIRSVQAGSRSAVIRRDFELLRQDRRRAHAAYPDVKEDDLYTGTWLQVDFSARVPDSFCNSGNSNGTQGADGKWYLDGGCYVSVVKAEYTKRADAATTKRVLAELRDSSRQKNLAHIKKWGYDTWWSGTGGSGAVYCYPDPLPSNEEADDLHVAGQCIIILDGKTKYQFPFDAADWVNPPYWSDGLTKLAESKGAKPVAYTPAPSKPWKMRDGALAHGQTCPPGRLCWSHWNSDKDTYDNEDIGPDTPRSWVLDTVLEIPMGYVPAPGNGELRSETGKPWYLVATYYGFAAQVSGGWDEDECKAAMPKLQTSQSFGMQGQDPEQLNRGNLREARCTQIAPDTGTLILKDKTLPVQPQVAREPETPCTQGMTLMPGQSCVAGLR